MARPEVEFDPRQIFEALRRREVRFVLIGGLAAQALGSAMLTKDTDICYDRADDNIVRLAAAIDDLRGSLRGPPRNLHVDVEKQTSITADHFFYDTEFGPLYCLGTPRGSRGYRELMANAIQLDLQCQPLYVSCLNDLIRMMRASDSLEDNVALEELGGLRDHIEVQPDDWVWKSGP
ncbi:MAG: hypothetical protein WEB00_12305 [Dehalococcoidia bacterium]